MLSDCSRAVTINTRIIVKTESNSKQLESRIRKEQIYYYYIDSFGLLELITALYSAFEIEKLTAENNSFNHEREDM